MASLKEQYTAQGIQVTRLTSGSSVADVDVLGNLKVSEPTMLVGAPFSGGTVDPNFWTETVTNDGTITDDGCLKLETNTTANGTAQLDSVRKARKIPGTVNQFRAVGKLVDSPVANNVRTIGCYDDDNGAFFKIDGTTFKIVTRKDSVDTEVSSGSFNGDEKSITLDTKIHRWVIEYTVLSVKFFYDNLLVHTVKAVTLPYSKSLTLPIRVTNENSNDYNVNIGLAFCLLTILRLGRLETEAISDYQSGQTAEKILKYGAGELKIAVISGVANNSVITLYDNISTSNTLWSSGAMGAQTQPFSLDFGGLPFSTGLTLSISGANSNITTVYE